MVKDSIAKSMMNARIVDRKEKFGSKKSAAMTTVVQGMKAYEKPTFNKKLLEIYF